MNDKNYTTRDELRDILDALDVGIFITDQDTNVLAVNSKFEKVTTISRNEIVGKKTEFMVDKQYISKSICQDVYRTRKTVTDILNYKTVGREVIVTGKPIFKADGSMSHIVCTLCDWDLLTDLYKELHDVKEQNKHYKEKLNALTRQKLAEEEYIAKDPKTKEMLNMAARIAEGDSTVLILGESGVGKGILAKFIYDHGPRKSTGSFVHVNCGAIPEALFEAEFFGYAPGAFTGANKVGKPGFLEIADNGALFLDEIGEMPSFIQAKLLKVLQDRTFTRVGDTREIKVDIKVMAATNQDLEQMVESGKFRQDLYYRLNVFNIFIPSLRDRKHDIPPLLMHHLKRFNEMYNQKKRLQPDVIEALMNYNWPGNIRELENTIERLVVLCPKESISSDDLPDCLTENFILDKAVRSSESKSLKTIVEQVEQSVIINAIDKTATLLDAARQLGIDLSTLTRKKQKYGIFKHGKTSLAQDEA